jgi:hypothetical protein
MSDNSDTGLDETRQIQAPRIRIPIRHTSTPAPSASTTPLFENPYTPGDIPADASFADVNAMIDQVDAHTRNIPDTSTPPEPSAPPAPEPTMADVRRLQQQTDAHIAKISPVDSPSDTIFKVGDSVRYFKNFENWIAAYSTYNPRIGKILLVHYDDNPRLYYTVRFPDGSEVQTIGKHLAIIPTPVSSHKEKTASVKEKQTPPGDDHPIRPINRTQFPTYNNGDDVMWMGEGLPNASTIIGITPEAGCINTPRCLERFDIRTNTERRISVPQEELYSKFHTIKTLDATLSRGLGKIVWDNLSPRYLKVFGRGSTTFFAVLAWLYLPPTHQTINYIDLFTKAFSDELIYNPNLYRKFRYEWNDEAEYYSQVHLRRTSMWASARHMNEAVDDNPSYLTSVPNPRDRHTYYTSDLKWIEIVLLQVTSNLTGRRIHLIKTNKNGNMNIITVEPDSTISDKELHRRRTNHGESNSSLPIWLKDSKSPEGYLFSYTDKPKGYIARIPPDYGYILRDGGSYPGDDDIPRHLIAADLIEIKNKKKEQKTRGKVIRLLPTTAQTIRERNKAKGCCGGSARSHRKRKTRKTRKMLKNRKKIKKTTHKRGRKTKTRKPRKTRKLRR